MCLAVSIIVIVFTELPAVMTPSLRKSVQTGTLCADDDTYLTPHRSRAELQIPPERFGIRERASLCFAGYDGCVGE